MDPDPRLRGLRALTDDVERAMRERERAAARRRRRRIGLLAAAGTLLVTSGTFAATGIVSPPRFGHDDPEARRVEREATALINRALRRVDAREACRRRRTTAMAPTRLVPGPAGPQVSALLGVFRRPSTRMDRAAAERLGRRSFGPFAAVPRDGVRVIRAPDGTRLTLVAGIRMRTYGPDPATAARCRAAVRRELIELAASAPRDVAKEALEIHAAELRQGTPPRPDDEGLSIRAGSGAGGGQFDRAHLIAHPVRLSIGSRIVLILPDGVARVELSYPRFASRGPYRDPVDYGRPLRVSAPVRDNVASLRVRGRATADLFTVAVIERAADGRIVRRVPARP